jgi:long-chain acyl-CoA synthetase
VQEPPTVEPLRSLADLVKRAAAVDPDRPALRSPEATITWGQLDARVDAAAHGLRALRLTSSGDHPARVAVALPNVPELVVALFATWRAGLVAVPINPGYTARELRHVLGDSGASVVIGTPDVVEAVQLVRADLSALRHIYVLGASFSILLAGGGAAGGDQPPGGEELAVILYTSGTEGQPKGAMLSHRALIANLAQLAEVEPPVLRHDDTVLLAVPMFHAYGLNTGLCGIAYHGACGVLVERFDPAHALELIARHHVTLIIGVPPMYVAWSVLAESASGDAGGHKGQPGGIGEAMASVRVAVCGAAPLEPATAVRFTDATRHPVFIGYGLTETAPVVASTLASPVPKPSSIGRPIPGVEVRLVSLDGEELWRGGGEPPELADLVDLAVTLHPRRGDRLELESPDSPGSDPGEIVVRGANLFSGYWPDGRAGPDPDGWWATGDVAYADADGDLFLVDRLAELILVSGFNVYPREVELVLQTHPGVVEAAVLGAPHPFTGQTVKAYVVRAEASDVTAEELLRHCERQLARFKCPTAMEFVAELPHSATGKVRKVALRSPAPPVAEGGDHG